MQTLNGLTIALAGGDEREAILCQALLQQGARVLAVGYPHRPDLVGVEHYQLIPAAQEADAVIAPITNTDENGRIKAQLGNGEPLVLDEVFFKAMSGKPLLIGAAKLIVQDLANRFHVTVVETAEDDEIAVLNSIPTAEGAIYRAMQETLITIHGSNSVVVGFGRCGMTLARMLRGIGADVTIAARNPAQMARGYEMGLHFVPLGSLADAAKQADFLFNTVPVRVVTSDVIEALPLSALIVDIASAPGGTDFAAAESRGIKAVLDLGIPGKIAPKTAGQILARTVPRLLLEACR